MEADVIVVGSGAGGLTAAVVAAKAGLDVLLLESTPWFGGTSAFSAGGVWIPVNHHMKQAGVDDSRPEAEAYLHAVLGDFYDEEKVGAYLDNAPAMLAYLEANSEVLLTASTIPDYSPDAPGWKSGRCLLPASYDGTKLGENFKNLRPPIPEMALFKGMQVSAADIYTMRYWNKSLPAFRQTISRFAGYAVDRLRYGRGTHLANGNALVGRLLKSAMDAGVTLLNNTPARRLVITDGAVTGVVVAKNDGQQTIRARKGVVLASGGFGANAEMRRKYVPQADDGWSLQPEGCQGDGINMGIEAGGALHEGNAANGIWVPASASQRADGSLAKFPSLFFDRHCPGSIMVDAATAKRFFNESFHYQSFGETVQEKGITKIWMISDTPAVRRYGMGMVKPAPFRINPWVKNGYIFEAGSIGALARKIGLDPAALEKTVSDFNAYADAGKDPDYHRGDDRYSAYMGDAMHKPNPALGSIRTGPFYALEIRPSDLSTFIGLNTNAKAQVLKDDGSPIDGLFAAGLDNNNMMRGRYPGGGASLGPAMTFGYIAAMTLASR